MEFVTSSGHRAELEKFCSLLLDCDNLHDAVESAMKEAASDGYNADDHNNDDLLKKTVSDLVDAYFVKNGGLEVKPWGKHFDPPCIADPEKRKKNVCENVMRSRGKPRPFTHYVGCDAFSNELCSFYIEMYNKYYATIGAKWFNS